MGFSFFFPVGEVKKMEKHLSPLTKILVFYIRQGNRKLYILEENALSWEWILKDSPPKSKTF